MDFSKLDDSFLRDAISFVQHFYGSHADEMIRQLHYYNDNQDKFPDIIYGWVKELVNGKSYLPDIQKYVFIAIHSYTFKLHSDQIEIGFRERVIRDLEIKTDEISNFYYDLPLHDYRRNFFGITLQFFGLLPSLLGLLKSSTEGNVKVSEGEIIEDDDEMSPELTKTGHKVVLLYELGIIDHLRKKYPNLNATKFSKLIGLIVGLQGNKLEPIRKGLSGYGQKTKDDPKTLSALNKIRSELIKLDIEIS